MYNLKFDFDSQQSYSYLKISHTNFIFFLLTIEIFLKLNPHNCNKDQTDRSYLQVPQHSNLDINL